MSAQAPAKIYILPHWDPGQLVMVLSYGIPGRVLQNIGHPSQYWVELTRIPANRDTNVLRINAKDMRLLRTEELEASPWKALPAPKGKRGGVSA